MEAGRGRRDVNTIGQRAGPSAGNGTPAPKKTRKKAKASTSRLPPPTPTTTLDARPIPQPYLALAPSPLTSYNAPTPNGIYNVPSASSTQLILPSSYIRSTSQLPTKRSSPYLNTATGSVSTSALPQTSAGPSTSTSTSAFPTSNSGVGTRGGYAAGLLAPPTIMPGGQALPPRVQGDGVQTVQNGRKRSAERVGVGGTPGSPGMNGSGGGNRREERLRNIMNGTGNASSISLGVLGQIMESGQMPEENVELSAQGVQNGQQGDGRRRRRRIVRPEAGGLSRRLTVSSREEGAAVGLARGASMRRVNVWDDVPDAGDAPPPFPFPTTSSSRLPPTFTAASSAGPPPTAETTTPTPEVNVIEVSERPRSPPPTWEQAMSNVPSPSGTPLTSLPEETSTPPSPQPSSHYESAPTSPTMTVLTLDEDGLEEVERADRRLWNADLLAGYSLEERVAREIARFRCRTEEGLKVKFETGQSEVTGAGGIQRVDGEDAGPSRTISMSRLNSGLNDMAVQGGVTVEDIVSEVAEAETVREAPGSHLVETPVLSVEPAEPTTPAITVMAEPEEIMASISTLTSKPTQLEAISQSATPAEMISIAPPTPPMVESTVGITAESQEEVFDHQSPILSDEASLAALAAQNGVNASDAVEASRAIEISEPASSSGVTEIAVAVTETSTPKAEETPAPTPDTTAEAASSSSPTPPLSRKPSRVKAVRRRSTIKSKSPPINPKEPVKPLFSSSGFPFPASTSTSTSATVVLAEPPPASPPPEPKSTTPVDTIFQLERELSVLRPRMPHSKTVPNSPATVVVSRTAPSRQSVDEVTAKPARQLRLGSQPNLEPFNSGQTLPPSREAALKRRELLVKRVPEDPRPVLRLAKSSTFSTVSPIPSGPLIDLSDFEGFKQTQPHPELPALAASTSELLRLLELDEPVQTLPPREMVAESSKQAEEKARATRELLDLAKDGTDLGGGESVPEVKRLQSQPVLSSRRKPPPPPPSMKPRMEVQTSQIVPSTAESGTESTMTTPTSATPTPRRTVIASATSPITPQPSSSNTTPTNLLLRGRPPSIPTRRPPPPPPVPPKFEQSLEGDTSIPPPLPPRLPPPKFESRPSHGRAYSSFSMSSETSSISDRTTTPFQQSSHLSTVIPSPPWKSRVRGGGMVRPRGPRPPPPPPRPWAKVVADTLDRDNPPVAEVHPRTSGDEGAQRDGGGDDRGVDNGEPGMGSPLRTDAPPSGGDAIQRSPVEYTDLDVLVSRLEGSGREFEGFTQIAAFLGPSKSPAATPEALSTLLPGPITVDSKRTTAQGKTKLKLSLLGVRVTKCPICLSTFRSGEIGVVLPNCGHFGHERCALQWFREDGRCFVCREVLGGEGVV